MQKKVSKPVYNKQIELGMEIRRLRMNGATNDANNPRRAIKYKDICKEINFSAGALNRLELCKAAKVPEPHALRSIADYFKVNIISLLLKTDYLNEDDLDKYYSEKKNK